MATTRSGGVGIGRLAAQNEGEGFVKVVVERPSRSVVFDDVLGDMLIHCAGLGDRGLVSSCRHFAVAVE